MSNIYEINLEDLRSVVGAAECWLDINDDLIDQAEVQRVKRALVVIYRAMEHQPKGRAFPCLSILKREVVP
jgi:hypothetical protein